MVEESAVSIVLGYSALFDFLALVFSAGSFEYVEI